MDVYGYQSYQYNQSDEMAKQMFAQQALASSMPYNRGVPEPHTMPAPSGAPWNVQGVPWGSHSAPQLVQFTGAPLMEATYPVVHSKRKSLDIEPAVPAKQLITEEKMAEHLSSLHISSNFTPHSLAEEYMDVGMDAPSTSTAISDKLKGHRIILSEEVKKLTEEPLIPAALIERLEKPHMSLVVWRPKEDILGKLTEVNEENDQGEQPTKRNGLLVAEPAGMDVEM